MPAENKEEKKQLNNFLDFVKSLSSTVLERLYTQSTTCIAVYR